MESVTKQTITAGAAGAEIVLGTNCIFAVSSVASATAAAPLNINIEFGPAGLGAPTASDFGLPVGQVFTFDTGSQFRSIRIFSNATTGPVDVYVMKLSKS